MRKVLVAEPCHPVICEELEKAGYHCDFNPTSDNEWVRSVIGDYYGLIVRSKVKIDSSLFDKANKLKFIGRVGSGMELFDLEGAKERGIICLNSPEGNRESVAEHAVGCMIGLLKSIRQVDGEIRQGIWNRKDRKGRELGSQTVGIIGFGNTGSALARKLRGFDCRILAYDKYKKGFGNEQVIETDMAQIFAESTIVSLHLPLTKETHYLADNQFFANFNGPIWFVNTSRGPIMKTTAVVEALESGKILGAALDVFETEPLKNLTNEEQQWFDSLKEKPNVILTPHTAGLTEDSFFKLAYILSQKIQENPQLSADGQNVLG